MTKLYEIEKGVPPPKNTKHLSYKEMVARMTAGDSVLLPSYSAASALREAAKKAYPNRLFRQQKQPDGTQRVWYIGDKE